MYKTTMGGGRLPAEAICIVVRYFLNSAKEWVGTRTMAPHLTQRHLDLLWAAHGLNGGSGQALCDFVNDRLDADVTHGSLYPSLNKLVEHGLLHRTIADGRTNRYTLTSAGAQLLSDRLAFVVDVTGPSPGDDDRLVAQ